MTQICADNDSFERDGFLLCKGVVSPDELDWIKNEVGEIDHPAGIRRRNGELFAVRDVFNASRALFQFANDHPLAALASAFLGADAFPTKATLFDKRAGANWSLPLHQDLTITVQAHADVSEFGPWTEKAGVPHVQPPDWVLRNIVALRVHLDRCSPENGALQVVRGSHKRGKIESGMLGRMTCAMNVECIGADAGDVLAMRPLLVHGSGKSEDPTRRRVLHIEYSCIELPPPLRWPNWRSD